MRISLLSGEISPRETPASGDSGVTSFESLLMGSWECHRLSRVPPWTSYFVKALEDLKVWDSISYFAYRLAQFRSFAISAKYSEFLTLKNLNIHIIFKNNSFLKVLFLPTWGLDVIQPRKHRLSWGWGWWRISSGSCKHR